MSITYILTAIAISALITFALRGLPFVVKTRLINSAFMTNFAKWMPIGAMVILFIYALSKAPWHAAVPLWSPYASGLLVTIGIHLWRKNFLLSIVLGTATCIALSILLN